MPITRSQIILKETYGSKETCHHIPAGSDIKQISWDSLSLDGQIIYSDATQHLFAQPSAFVKDTDMTTTPYVKVDKKYCKSCQRTRVFSGNTHCAACKALLALKPPELPKTPSEAPKAILSETIARPEPEAKQALQSAPTPSGSGALPGDEALYALLGAIAYAKYKKTQILESLIRELAQ